MKYRKISQIILLITGMAMISYGAVRGEAAAVLSKAIRNWIRTNHCQKKQPEYADGYRQQPRCLPIFTSPIYLKARSIRAMQKQYAYQD